MKIIDADKFKEGSLYQVVLTHGGNMVVKAEGGFFRTPAWCQIHKKMEWLKVVDPINTEEVKEK